MKSSHSPARKLKALQIDIEGRITLDGAEVRAIPVSDPALVFVEDALPEGLLEGRSRHRYYSTLERYVNIPRSADAFIFGKITAHGEYAPIQFYKIVR